MIFSFPEPSLSKVERAPRRFFRHFLRAVGGAASLFFITGFAQSATAANSPGQIPSSAPIDDQGGHASLGSLVAQQMHLADLGWNDAQIDSFLAGIRAGIAGRGIPPSDATRRLTDQIDRLSAARDQELAPASATKPSVSSVGPPSVEKFMASAKAGFALQQSTSGLLFKVIQPGSGPRPRPQDTVVLTINATAPDGKTPLPVLSGKNARAKVSDLLPGLVEGVQMLALGGRIVLVVPPALSFANGDWPTGVERNIPILFEIALEDIVTDRVSHR